MRSAQFASVASGLLLLCASLPGPLGALIDAHLKDTHELSRLTYKYVTFTQQLHSIRWTFFNEATRETLLPFKQDITKGISTALHGLHLRDEVVRYVDVWLETDIMQTALCPKLEVTVEVRAGWSFFETISTIQDHNKILAECAKQSPLPRAVIERVVIPRAEIMLQVISMMAPRWSVPLLFMAHESVSEIYNTVHSILQDLLRHGSEEKVKRHLTFNPRASLKPSDRVTLRMLDSIASSELLTELLKSVQKEPRMEKLEYSGNGVFSVSALKAYVDNNTIWLQNTIHHSYSRLSALDRLLWSVKLTLAAFLKYSFLITATSPNKTPFLAPPTRRPHLSFFQTTPTTSIRTRFLCMQMTSSLFHEHRALVVMSVAGLLYHFEGSRHDGILADVAAERDVVEWAVIRRQRPDMAVFLKRKMTSHYYHAELWRTPVDEMRMRALIGVVMGVDIACR